jgi:uncharacterized protein YjfI (DUF2170 family)
MSESTVSQEGLSKFTEVIHGWLENQLKTKTVVQSVEHDHNERRWYVRITGEEKDNSMIVFTLGQRTLHYETYMMPAPEENKPDFFRHLLRRNQKMYGLAFSIGSEDAIYLAGQISSELVNESTLDRVLGTFYSTIELCFQPALRLGFASRFREKS